jgi:uncharacterized protein (TIGR02246 family)
VGNICTAAILALVLAAPIRAYADTLAQIRPQITAANNHFGPAVLRHDAATIAGDYLTDGVVIPREGAPIRGRTAIARYYAKRLPALSRYNIHCATQRLAFDGTAVLEEGACTFAPRENTQKPRAPAHFLTIWKKDFDGRWRIAINA